eukprot:TRINITY_DN2372_c0_g2_i1.p1 TRINITY_DN2372_c0_g2~~TRINITY_DN2372_c0_g2_i1.p1  ORF type:complete len:3924 (+),score=928.96 TRINITY_DN2372_c0_g2_i1:918-12689(+)
MGVRVVVSHIVMRESYLVTYMDDILGWILKQYLSEIFEGSYTFNSNLRAYEGTNLKIKKQYFLETIGLPFTPKDSVLDRLTIKIPELKEIGKKPLFVSIQNLYILLEPCSSTKVSDIELCKHILKKGILNFSQSLQSFSFEKSVGKKESGGYMDAMRMKIVENIQMSISNIHIRYEHTTNEVDRDKTGSHVMYPNISVTLEKLDMESSSDSKSSDFSNPNNKTISFSNFSVFTTSSFVNTDPKDQSVFRDSMLSMIYLHKELPKDVKDLNVIVNKVSGRVQITLNFEKNINIINAPKSNIQIFLQKSQDIDSSSKSPSTMPTTTVTTTTTTTTPTTKDKNILVQLSTDQIKSMYNMSLWYQSYYAKLQYSQFFNDKPKAIEQSNDTGDTSESVSSKWWRYAYQCVRHKVKEQRNRITKEYMDQRIIDKRSYTSLFSKQLMGQELEESEIAEFELLEKKYSESELVYFRTLTIKYMKEEQKLLKQKENSKDWMDSLSKLIKRDDKTTTSSSSSSSSSSSTTSTTLKKEDKKKESKKDDKKITISNFWDPRTYMNSSDDQKNMFSNGPQVLKKIGSLFEKRIKEVNSDQKSKEEKVINTLFNYQSIVKDQSKGRKNAEDIVSLEIPSFIFQIREPTSSTSSSSLKTLVTFALSDFSILSRTRETGSTVTLSIGSIRGVDHYSRKDDPYLFFLSESRSQDEEKIVGFYSTIDGLKIDDPDSTASMLLPKYEKVTNVKKSLEVSVDINPVRIYDQQQQQDSNMSPDLLIKIKQQPFKFCFSNLLNKKLGDIFQGCNENSLLDYSNVFDVAPYRSILSIKDIISNSIQNRYFVDMDVDINSPSIVIPTRANDPYAPAILIDCDSISVRTNMNAHKARVTQGKRYEKFDVFFKSLRFVSVNDMYGWIRKAESRSDTKVTSSPTTNTAVVSNTTTVSPAPPLHHAQTESQLNTQGLYDMSIDSRFSVEYLVFEPQNSSEPYFKFSGYVEKATFNTSVEKVKLLVSTLDTIYHQLNTQKEDQSLTRPTTTYDFMRILHNIDSFYQSLPLCDVLGANPSSKMLQIELSVGVFNMQIDHETYNFRFKYESISTVVDYSFNTNYLLKFKLGRLYVMDNENFHGIGYFLASPKSSSQDLINFTIQFRIDDGKKDKFFTFCPYSIELQVDSLEFILNRQTTLRMTELLLSIKDEVEQLQKLFRSDTLATPKNSIIENANQIRTTINVNSLTIIFTQSNIPFLFLNLSRIATKYDDYYEFDGVFKLESFIGDVRMGYLDVETKLWKPIIEFAPEKNYCEFSIDTSVIIKEGEEDKFDDKMYFKLNTEFLQITYNHNAITNIVSYFSYWLPYVDKIINQQHKKTVINLQMNNIAVFVPRSSFDCSQHLMLIKLNNFNLNQTFETTVTNGEEIILQNFSISLEESSIMGVLPYTDTTIFFPFVPRFSSKITITLPYADVPNAPKMMIHAKVKDLQIEVNEFTLKLMNSIIVGNLSKLDRSDIDREGNEFIEDVISIEMKYGLSNNKQFINQPKSIGMDVTILVNDNMSIVCYEGYGSSAKNNTSYTYESIMTEEFYSPDLFKKRQISELYQNNSYMNKLKSIPDSLYIVRKGDSASSLSHIFDIDKHSLKRMNALQKSEKIDTRHCLIINGINVEEKIKLHKQKGEDNSPSLVDVLGQINLLKMAPVDSPKKTRNSTVGMKRKLVSFTLINVGFKFVGFADSQYKIRFIINSILVENHLSDLRQGIAVLQIVPKSMLLNESNNLGTPRKLESTTTTSSSNTDNGLEINVTKTKEEISTQITIQCNPIQSADQPSESSNQEDYGPMIHLESSFASTYTKYSVPFLLEFIRSIKHLRDNNQLFSLSDSSMNKNNDNRKDFLRASQIKKFLSSSQTFSMIRKYMNRTPAVNVSLNIVNPRLIISNSNSSSAMIMGCNNISLKFFEQPRKQTSTSSSSSSSPSSPPSTSRSTSTDISNQLIFSISELNASYILLPPPTTKDVKLDDKEERKRNNITDKTPKYSLSKPLVQPVSFTVRKSRSRSKQTNDRDETDVNISFDNNLHINLPLTTMKLILSYSKVFKDVKEMSTLFRDQEIKESKSIEFSLGITTITLIDDRNEVYSEFSPKLFRFTNSKFSLNGSIDRETQIEVFDIKSYNFMLDSFNLRVGSWEPIIEPWSSHFLYKMSESDQRLKVTSLKSTEDDKQTTTTTTTTTQLSPIIITLTPNSISSLMNSYKYLNEMYKQTTHVSSSIKFTNNDTEFQIDISNKTDQTLYIKLINANEKMEQQQSPLRFSKSNQDKNDWDTVFSSGSKAIKSDRNNIESKLLSIKTEYDTFTIDDIKISSSGNQSAPTYYIAGELLVTCLATTTSQLSICITSRNFIKNSTQSPVQIKILPNFRENGYQINSQTLSENSYTDVTLNPSEEYSVPLALSSISKALVDLYIRPSQNYSWTKWDPSKERIVSKIIDSKVNSDENNEYWESAVYVDYEEIKPNTFKNIIKIVPMLIIKNSLASEIMYSFDNSTVEINKRISGFGIQSIAIHHVNNLLNSSFSICLDNDNGKSEPVSISSLENNQKISVPIIQGDEEPSKSMKLMLQTSVTNSGYTKVINISSSYWIINQTGLPLTIIPSNNSTIKLPKYGNVCYSETSTFEIQLEKSKYLVDLMKEKKSLESSSTSYSEDFEILIQTALWDYTLTLSTAVGKNEFKNTMFIYIRPAYVAVNNTMENLIFKTKSCPYAFELEIGQQKAVYWAKDHSDIKSLALCRLPMSPHITPPVVLSEYSDILKTKKAPENDLITNDTISNVWTDFVPVEQFFDGSGARFRLTDKIFTQGNVRHELSQNSNIIKYNSYSVGVHYLVFSECLVKGKGSDSNKKFELTCNFPSLSVSLVDSKPVEILNVTIDNINLSYSNITESKSESFSLMIQNIQIDNQNKMTTMPITLKNDKKALLRDDKLEILQLNAERDCEFNYPYWKDINLHVQPIKVCVDEVLVSSILCFYKDVLHLQSIVMQHHRTLNKSNSLTDQYDVLIKPVTELSKDKLIYDNMWSFEKIRINLPHLSLALNPVDVIETTGNLYNVLSKMKFISTSTSCSSGSSGSSQPPIPSPNKVLEIFSSVEKIILASPHPISLNNLSVYPNSIAAILEKKIEKHYREIWKKSIQSCESSVDKLKSNLVDVSSSLVDTVTFGVLSDSNTSDSKTPAFLEKIGDKYKKKKPRHLVEGIAYGLRDFGVSVVDGVTGVVTEPIKGAMKDGAIGAIKGVGKGLVGVVATPVTGTIDLVMQTAEGLRSTPDFVVKSTTSLFKKAAKRKRPPRIIGSDMIIRPVYDKVVSDGQELLRAIENGTYANFNYLCQFAVHQSDILLIAMQMAIYLVKSKDRSKEQWSVQWRAKRLIYCPKKDKDVSSINFKIYDENWNASDQTVKLSQKNPQTFKLILEKLDHLLIKPNQTKSNFVILPHLSEQYEKFGIIEVLNNTTWNTLYCALSKGYITYTPQGKKAAEKISIRNSPLIIRNPSENLFTVISSSNLNPYHFKATSQSEYYKWIHVAIQNTAYLIEEFQPPVKTKKLILQTKDEKLISAPLQSSSNSPSSSPTNTTITSSNYSNNQCLTLVTRTQDIPDSCIFISEQVNPQEVVIKGTYEKDGVVISEKYLTVDHNNTVIQSVNNSKTASIFRIIKNSDNNSISLRTRDGYYLKDFDNEIVLTLPQINQPEFNQIFLPSTISIQTWDGKFVSYSKKTKNFVLVSSITDSDQVFVLKKNSSYLNSTNEDILNQSRFYYNIMSWGKNSQYFTSVSESSVNLSKSEQPSSSEKFYFVKLSSGLCYIKTHLGGYIYTSHNSLLINENKFAQEKLKSNQLDRSRTNNTANQTNPSPNPSPKVPEIRELILDSEGNVIIKGQPKPDLQTKKEEEKTRIQEFQKQLQKEKEEVIINDRTIGAQIGPNGLFHIIYH